MTMNRAAYPEGESQRRKMTLLPEGFTPGDDDVICGRGKKCYSHVGNERFRLVVLESLDDYAQAKSKLDKSGVLARVVDQVRAKSPKGGFVKQLHEDGRWYEVGDFLAKEKTSQMFRDALHERYKSSNVAKKKKRLEEQARHTERLRRIASASTTNPGGVLSRASLAGVPNAGKSNLGCNWLTECESSCS